MNNHKRQRIGKNSGLWQRKRCLPPREEAGIALELLLLLNLTPERSGERARVAEHPNCGADSRLDWNLNRIVVCRIIEEANFNIDPLNGHERFADVDSLPCSDGVELRVGHLHRLRLSVL